ncbi:hypothetical protein F2Q69_00051655 [Brassica cretica]|uniref:Uncharacterized protein n=1 Tax=Brassica cretica TaxID=69181 RepID=A0A8S9PP78_BRACR|nr:hypothetical protein F2Q69_00051655 [Brassica cretica]
MVGGGRTICADTERRTSLNHSDEPNRYTKPDRHHQVAYHHHLLHLGHNRQSIAKLLENYYYLHTTNKRRATWFQSLLQVIGFPFLHTPLYFLLYPDPRKPNQLPPSSDRTSLRFLTLLYPGVLSAIFAAFSFSYIITGSQKVFDNVISKRDVATNRKPSFASVFELIFFSSIFATIVFLAGLFITGEHHVVKTEVRGFSDGKRAYILTMMGQVGAWQVYCVGLVGLVFAVSSMFSNVISVCFAKRRGTATRPPAS